MSRMTNDLTIEPTLSATDRPLSPSLSPEMSGQTTNEECVRLRGESKSLTRSDPSLTALTHMTDQLNLGDSGADDIDLQQVMQVLSQCQTLTQEMDCKLQELLVTLIARQPRLVTDSLLDAFMAKWTESQVMVRGFINVHNVSILAEQCPNQSHNWNKYETTIIKMLSSGVTTAATVEADILKILKHEWNDQTLRQLATCMQSVSAYIKKNNLYDKSQELNESETIDWLSWLCAQD